MKREQMKTETREERIVMSSEMKLGMKRTRRRRRRRRRRGGGEREYREAMRV